MKKILFLALHLGYGGVEKAIVSEANILIENYQVEIACAYKLHDTPAFLLDKRVKVHYLSEHIKPNKEELRTAIKSKKLLHIVKEGWKSLKILHHRTSKMKQMIKHSDADIIISTRYLYNSILGKNRKQGVITIAQEHNHHKNDKKYIRKIIRSVQRIDYFMPVSKELTEFYKTRVKNAKCLYIPHSLEYIPSKTSELEEPILISVGRLSKEKGFLDLIKVYELIAEDYPQWVLHIVGDGNERENIKDYIKKRNLDTKVVLHGFQHKEYINNLLARSSIYVMTSFEESFGIVLIEAQSFGIPCVAYDSARGAMEIIKDEENGYLISNRSAEEMCKKLKALIDNPKLRKKLGERARANSIQYSAERIKSMWFEFIDSECN